VIFEAALSISRRSSSIATDFRTVVPRFTPETASESAVGGSAGQNRGTEEGDTGADRAGVAFQLLRDTLQPSD